MGKKFFSDNFIFNLINRLSFIILKMYILVVVQSQAKLTLCEDCRYADIKKLAELISNLR